MGDAVGDAAGDLVGGAVGITVDGGSEAVGGGMPMEAPPGGASAIDVSAKTGNGRLGEAPVPPVVPVPSAVSVGTGEDPWLGGAAGRAGGSADDISWSPPLRPLKERSPKPNPPPIATTSTAIAATAPGQRRRLLSGGA